MITYMSVCLKSTVKCRKNSIAFSMSESIHEVPGHEGSDWAELASAKVPNTESARSCNKNFGECVCMPHARRNSAIGSWYSMNVMNADRDFYVPRLAHFSFRLFLTSDAELRLSNLQGVFS